MSDDATKESKPLHGAAAASAARKAAQAGQPTDLSEFLAQLASGIDERIAEAQAIVEQKQAELEEAPESLRLLESLKAVQSGEFQLTPPPAPAPRKQGTSTRAPRAEGAAIAAKITEVLKEAGADGMVVADILPKVMPNKDEFQKCRNQLARMVKSGAIGKAGDFYRLP